MAVKFGDINFNIAFNSVTVPNTIINNEILVTGENSSRGFDIQLNDDKNKPITTQPFRIFLLTKVDENITKTEAIYKSNGIYRALFPEVIFSKEQEITFQFQIEQGNKKLNSQIFKRRIFPEMQGKTNFDIKTIQQEKLESFFANYDDIIKKLENTNVNIPVVTQEKNGLMSKEDKAKLDDINKDDFLTNDNLPGNASQSEDGFMSSADKVKLDTYNGEVFKKIQSISNKIVTDDNFNNKARELSGLNIVPGNGFGDACVRFKKSDSRFYEFFASQNGFGVYDKPKSKYIMSITDDTTVFYYPIRMENQKITMLGEPKSETDATTKKYVDSKNTIKEVKSNQDIKFWTGTKDEYSVIKTKDVNTIYFVKE